jgi:hypothetical protein
MVRARKRRDGGTINAAQTEIPLDLERDFERSKEKARD